MKSRTTPAVTKTLAAIAKLTFVGCVAQAMRKAMVATRDMQKPPIMPEMMNLWPRLFRLIWRMVKWQMAPVRKRKIKTALIGTSTETVGRPPRPAVVAG